MLGLRENWRQFSLLVLVNAFVGAMVGLERTVWRDMGYAVGALSAGALSDALGMPTAIGSIGALTMAPGLLVAWCMPETASGR